MATPAALKLKTCTKTVRQGSKIVKCGKQYLGDKCPDKGIHVLALVTGFCDSGWHEGTKATDWRGRPAGTCKFFQTCPCECHNEIGKLFELTGTERILVDSSGYVPDLGGFVMPDVGMDDPSFIRADSDPASGLQEARDSTASGLESVAGTPAPARFAPTPTGRAARGQLEWWVHEQVRIWTVEGYDFACTPVWISKEIGRDQGIDPPSVGAISAVFERWSNLGFAIIEKKPTRFAGLTEDGKTKGLDRMKAEAKRREKMHKAEMKRGRLR